MLIVEEILEDIHVFFKRKTTPARRADIGSTEVQRLKNMIGRLLEEIKKHNKIFKEFKADVKNSEFFIIFLNV